MLSSWNEAQTITPESCPAFPKPWLVAHWLNTGKSGKKGSIVEAALCCELCENRQMDRGNALYVITGESGGLELHNILPQCWAPNAWETPKPQATFPPALAFLESGKRTQGCAPGSKCPHQMCSLSELWLSSLLSTVCPAVTFDPNRVFAGTSVGRLKLAVWQKMIPLTLLNKWDKSVLGRACQVLVQGKQGELGWWCEIGDEEPFLLILACELWLRDPWSYAVLVLYLELLQLWLLPREAVFLYRIGKENQLFLDSCFVWGEEQTERLDFSKTARAIHSAFAYMGCLNTWDWLRIDWLLMMVKVHLKAIN